MPTLYQIASYSKMFRLLRGRRPSVRETMRYFADEAEHPGDDRWTKSSPHYRFGSKTSRNIPRMFRQK